MIQKNKYVFQCIGLSIVVFFSSIGWARDDQYSSDNSQYATEEQSYSDQETDDSEDRGFSTPFFIRFGIENGGEDVVNMERLWHEHNIVTRDMFFAGGLYSVALGVSFDHPQFRSPQSTEVSVGWKHAERDAEGHHFTFTRYPIDVIHFLVVDDVKLGAGITYHVKPEVKAYDELSDLSETFRNEFGFLLEANYQMSPSYWVGVRATLISYHTDTRKVGAESFGLTLAKFF